MMNTFLVSRARELLAAFLVFAFLVSPVPEAEAAAPEVIPYVGKVAVNGLNFDGNASFKFALVDEDNATVWSNDANGSAVSVDVDRGHYLVLLGETSVPNMAALPASVLADHAGLRLRVHFDDGVRGFLHLQPDQPLRSSPYALVARIAAAVKDGSVTKDMLAPGVLEDLNATISSGSVTKDMLAADALGHLPALLDAYLRPILRKPVGDVSGLAGGSAALVVEVDGRGLSYEWRRNGTLLSGATGPSLALADLNATLHDGNYSVRASNAFGQVESNGTLVVAAGPPALTFEANATFAIDEGAAFTHPAFSAADSLGADLSGSVEVNGSVNAAVPGSYSLVYRVTDSSGKTTEVTKTVVVRDATPPLVALNGPALVHHAKGDAYVDAGATAHDLVDGNLTSAVTASGSVDANASGVYVVTYSASDAAGNVGQATRQVVVSATPADFAFIPAGPFVMGKDDEPQRHSPAHEVYLSAFYVGKYELTKAVWDETRAWAVDNGYDFHNSFPGLADGNASTFPVHKIMWYDVVKWCNAHSERANRRPVYYLDPAHTQVYRTEQTNLSNDLVDWNADGFRLPTEAEWEKAARGGLEGKAYPNGDVGGGSIGNVQGNGIDKPVVGGAYAPNDFGLYDVYGNVWEWVWDKHDEDWYDEAAASVADVRGPNLGSMNRTLRSGLWGQKVYERGGGGPNSTQVNHIGFRLAISGTLTSSLALPHVLSDSNGSLRVGNAFSHSLVAVNNPAAYSASGLPPGLSLNSATGEISGSPTQGGSYSVTLTATNANGSASKTVFYTVKAATPKPFLLLDLRAGKNASAYPVTALDALPADFETNATRYRSDFLVMKYVAPGVFQMGDDTSSVAYEKPRHQVTLTRGYYLGLYHVTGAQYDKVTGSDPSAYGGDARPVDKASWNAIRGGNWPVGDRAPAGNTFLGKLRDRTGMGFDLPTEAQWEYAARAGRGDDWLLTESRLEQVWTKPTSGDQPLLKEAGSLLPNAWGFYDLPGNLREWTLDMQNTYPSTAQTNPEGPGAGSNRIIRGASFQTYPSQFRFSFREFESPSNHDHGQTGFRLCLPLADVNATAWPHLPLFHNLHKPTRAFQGVGFSKPLDVSFAPTSFAAAGLPPGLSVSEANGTLSGTPTSAGVFDLNVTASNSVGAAQATLRIEVLPAAPKRYAVLDLTAGASASQYPVTYHDALPADFESNATRYKTDKVLLRYVSPGTFVMGTNTPEPAQTYVSQGAAHQVTLTKGFYLGVYEVTDTQWGRVAGTNPSNHNSPRKPVVNVSWNQVRGGVSNSGDKQPAAGSFLALLRERTGLSGFDLPTEAQWEYACRAGTTTPWSWGDKRPMDYGNFAYVSFWSANEWRDVGSFLANPWGFHDMHGNADEWVRDGKFQNGAFEPDPVTDPLGPNDANLGERIQRGGNYYNFIPLQTSTYRGYGYAHHGGNAVSFRLVLETPDYPQQDVDFPPVLHKPFALSANKGQDLNATLTAADDVTAWAASGLPPGVTLNAGTGAFEGNATTPGSYFAEVNATNAAGTTSTRFPIAVRPANDKTYAVIDLSAGHVAEHYGVSFLHNLPTDWNASDGGRSNKLVLKRVQAGTFTIGDWNNTDGSNARPAHQVTLTHDYYLGIFEVTDDQWKKVMGSSPSSGGGGDRPAEGMKWDLARGGDWPANYRRPDRNSFIGLLRERTGFTTIDLPTEAQWERACRAGTTTRFFWGNDTSLVNTYAWYANNSDNFKRPVGLKQPNPWGFYDMAGGVEEWTIDQYAPFFSAEAVTNPEGHVQRGNSVLKGGGYQHSLQYLVSSRRYGSANHHGSANVGIRVCLTVR